MRHGPYKFTTLFLALLLAVSSLVPATGRAEAQMRCVGASPHSAPCARVELPGAGLTETQVYGKLMACCRSTRGGCAMMRGCPMRHPSHKALGVHRTPSSAAVAVSSRHCLVTVRVSASVVPDAARTRWLLTSCHALAPPVDAPTVGPALPTVRVTSWTYTPVLSPHVAPSLHGLRAPPIA